MAGAEADDAAAGRLADGGDEAVIPQRTGSAANIRRADDSIDGLVVDIHHKSAIYMVV